MCIILNYDEALGLMKPVRDFLTSMIHFDSKFHVVLTGG